jgi:hypothetical protein
MRHTNGTPIASGSPGFSAAFALAEPGTLFSVRVHGQDPGGVAYSIGVELPSIAVAGTGDFGGVDVGIARLVPSSGSVGVDVSLNALAHEASLDQLASQGRWVMLRGADLYGESDGLSLVFGRGTPGETRKLAMSVRVEGPGGTITLPITEDYTWFDDEIGG